MIDTISRFLTTGVIHHGPGSLTQLEVEFSKYNVKCAGFVTDPGVVKAGIKEKVLEELQTNTVWFEDVLPEPPAELVGKCVTFLKKHSCDIVVGIGGGSSLDTAKMAAVMLGNPGSVTDYFGANRIPESGLPVIAIPTTAGTGSEVSPAAVFVDPSDGAKKGVRSDFIMPTAAILDPVLTLTLPQHLTAATGLDALTHAIECYTAPRATIISDLAAETSIRLIGEHLRTAYGSGNNIDARYGMLMASYFAGLSLSIANVGAVHAFAQTLGGLYKISHGLANALFLPYIMDFNRISCRKKFRKIAILLGESIGEISIDDAALRAVEAVRRLNHDLNIPQHIQELDIAQECVERIPPLCMEAQRRLLDNNARTLSLEDARQIMKQAY